MNVSDAPYGAKEEAPRYFDQDVLLLLARSAPEISEMSEPLRRYCEDLAENHPEWLEILCGRCIVTQEGRDYARRSR